MQNAAMIQSPDAARSGVRHIVDRRGIVHRLDAPSSVHFLQSMKFSGEFDELAQSLGVDTGFGVDTSFNGDEFSGKGRHGGGHPVTESGKPIFMQVFAFPATAIATTVTNNNIGDRVERRFRCERFALGSRSARFFLINNLSIGRESMWVNNQGAPGEGFSEVAFGVSLYGWVAEVANQITLSATNVDANSQTITAFIRGPSVT